MLASGVIILIGVVATTINVLCELARHNAHDYLPLAPQLFHLLTTSSNNWMLIKIVKLVSLANAFVTLILTRWQFGYLTPNEPRLVKKLQPPITELISTTPAISLLYECVRTCIIGGMLQGLAGNSLARTCVTKLATFLEDEDQNCMSLLRKWLSRLNKTLPFSEVYCLDGDG